MNGWDCLVSVILILTGSELLGSCVSKIIAAFRFPKEYIEESSTEVIRASGDYICKTCGKKFYDHPKYAYPTTGHAIKGCNGKFYHL